MKKEKNSDRVLTFIKTYCKTIIIKTVLLDHNKQAYLFTTEVCDKFVISLITFFICLCMHNSENHKYIILYKTIWLQLKNRYTKQLVLYAAILLDEIELLSGH